MKKEKLERERKEVAKTCIEFALNKRRENGKKGKWGGNETGDGRKGGNGGRKPQQCGPRPADMRSKQTKKMV